MCFPFCLIRLIIGCFIIIRLVYPDADHVAGAAFWIILYKTSKLRNLLLLLKVNIDTRIVILLKGYRRQDTVIRQCQGNMGIGQYVLAQIAGLR